MNHDRSRQRARQNFYIQRHLKELFFEEGALADWYPINHRLD